MHQNTVMPANEGPVFISIVEKSSGSLAAKLARLSGCSDSPPKTRQGPWKLLIKQQKKITDLFLLSWRLFACKIKSAHHCEYWVELYRLTLVKTCSNRKGSSSNCCQKVESTPRPKTFNDVALRFILIVKRWPKPLNTDPETEQGTWPEGHPPLPYSEETSRKDLHCHHPII